MKSLIDTLFSSIRWLIALVTGIVSLWLFLDSHFDQKVIASEKRVLDKVEAYRAADMTVIKAIKEDTDLIKKVLMERK